MVYYIPCITPVATLLDTQYIFVTLVFHKVSGKSGPALAGTENRLVV